MKVQVNSIRAGNVIEYNGKLHVFHDLEKVGPVTQKLYNELTGIQSGDVEAPAGWIVKVA